MRPNKDLLIRKMAACRLPTWSSRSKRPGEEVSGRFRHRAEPEGAQPHQRAGVDRADHPAAGHRPHRDPGAGRLDPARLKDVIGRTGTPGAAHGRSRHEQNSAALQAGAERQRALRHRADERPRRRPDSGQEAVRHHRRAHQRRRAGVRHSQTTSRSCASAPTARAPACCATSPARTSANRTWRSC